VQTSSKLDDGRSRYFSGMAGNRKYSVFMCIIYVIFVLFLFVLCVGKTIFIGHNVWYAKRITFG